MISHAALEQAVAEMEGPDSLAELGVEEYIVRGMALRVGVHLMCDHPHLMGVKDVDVLLAAATAYGFELGLRAAQVSDG